MRTAPMLASLAVALVCAPAALASHSFPADVPDSHQFHAEIGIFKDTNITVGCTATAFCPQDPVKRQAMAAFIDRALGLVVRPGESTQKGVPGSRVALLDDDLSFVGTSGGALAYRGPNDNVVGGSSNNFGGVTTAATVAGGNDNGVTGVYGSIGGGLANRAGYLGVVPGGFFNTAGNHSFAAGYRAKAFHDGSFVWADAHTFDFGTGGENSFIARATGGVDFVTGINDSTGAATAGVGVASGASAWSSLSDRASKREFARVAGAALLRSLARIPVTTWSYKAQARSIRHIGPMAQDFRRAFGVGEDARRISTVDADGVALAAVQALYRRSQAQAARIDALERELAGLRKQMRG